MEIKFPISEELPQSLKPGQELLISGDLLVARDQSLQKIIALLNQKENFLNMSGRAVFFAGPLPRDPIIIGPTTSRRMDKFVPELFSYGVKATIGKGPVGKEVINACQKYRSMYLAVTGGVSAYLSQFIQEMKIILWPELGPEAVYNLKVEKMPAIVSVNPEGNTVYAFNY